MWEKCGDGSQQTGPGRSPHRIPEIREEYWKNVIVLGNNEEINGHLEKAGRVAGFIDIAQLMCLDD